MSATRDDLSMNLRRHNRRHLYTNLSVLDATTRRLLGHMGDLTVEGLLLLSPDPFPIGAVLDLEVVLPKGFEGESLTARAATQWSQRDANPALHLVGLRFENLGLREQVNVELLCKLVAFRDV